MQVQLLYEPNFVPIIFVQLQTIESFSRHTAVTKQIFHFQKFEIEINVIINMLCIQCLY